MRRRFFFIIFGFLIASIIIVSTLQYFFFENERLRLLDHRMETVASSLIASGLSLDLIENLETTDNLISDLLGEERIDFIINIYSTNGVVLAHNLTAAELPLIFNSVQGKETYEVKDRTIRVINLIHGRLILQVGMIMDPALDRWNMISTRFIIFGAGISALLLFMAFLSSRILFTPLRKLTHEFRSMSGQLERKLGQPLSGYVVGFELARLSNPKKKNKDDFEILCEQISSFLKKLEDYTKSFNAQTTILTHELKTPLTLLKNYVEELKRIKNDQKSNEYIDKILKEIDRLTYLINNYLQWSVLASNPEQPNELYVLKLSEVANSVVSELNSINHHRIEFKNLSDTKIFVMPDHLRQLLSNLLTNALNYSPEAKPVICEIANDQLIIQDFGSGIPQMVLDHLGSPFNRGEGKSRNQKSSGLGLAWIHALCEKYHWNLKIESNHLGTTISVKFPPI